MSNEICNLLDALAKLQALARSTGQRTRVDRVMK